MAISDTQKVDYLFKKVGYTLSKTDTATAKSPANESIPSPLITRGDYVWQQSSSIPSTIPGANSSVITIYSDALSDTVKATVDSTATANRTWLTGLTNWIDPSFGSTYQAKVYVVESGTTNPQTSGYQLFADGSGNNDSWYFDYSSGVLNFPDTNLPYYANGLAVSFTGKSIFVSGARYTGATGLANIALQTTYSNAVTFNSNVNANANLIVSNALTVNGNITTGNLSTVGNVTAYRFYGDGSQLTNVGSNYSNANVAQYLPTYSGNIGAYNVNANIYTSNIGASSANANIFITPGANGYVSVNTNTAFQVPVGTNTSYPPVNRVGMLRWNSDLGYLEVYTGINWEAVGIEGGTTNVVSDVISSGNGSQTQFTLSQNNTTTGTLVSINGVIQLPTTSYTVSGNVITFNEAPLSTDIIEVRQYVPSTTVGNLSSGNASLSMTAINGISTARFINDGLTTLTVDSANVNVFSQLQVSMPIVANVANTAVNTTTAIIDDFPPTQYRTAKYVISAQNYSSNYFQSAEALVTHNGTTANVVTYATISTNTQLFTLSANIYNSNVSLWATTTTNGNNIKVSATYIPL
jgi:hypothetical protein